MVTFEYSFYEKDRWVDFFSSLCTCNHLETSFVDLSLPVHIASDANNVVIEQFLESQKQLGLEREKNGNSMSRYLSDNNRNSI